LGEKLEVTYPNIYDLVGILKNKGRGSVTALSTYSSKPQDINNSPKVSYAFQAFSFVSAPPKQ
jgi:hypothetical protein